MTLPSDWLTNNLGWLQCVERQSWVYKEPNELAEVVGKILMVEVKVCIWNENGWARMLPSRKLQQWYTHRVSVGQWVIEFRDNN